jgi:hypothetical protein
MGLQHAGWVSSELGKRSNFQELMAEGFAMLHRFAAKPIFLKKGKGFLISEGVANSPAFGQFGFRLEIRRTGLHSSFGWRKIGGKRSGSRSSRKPAGTRNPMKLGYLKWCPDQELNLDQRFRNSSSISRPCEKPSKCALFGRVDGAQTGRFDAFNCCAVLRGSVGWAIPGGRNEKPPTDRNGRPDGGVVSTSRT